MVSVVIPLYNKADTITRAIQSVMKQTISEWELIVVDNGSTDDGSRHVEAIKDSRIRLIRQENKGVSMARNRGVEEATCDYIAFLDADDEWKPLFLEQSLSLQKEYPECDLYASAYERCTPDGTIQPIRISQELSLRNTARNTCIIDNYFEVAAASDPPFCSISVMVRKKSLLDIGGFPKGIHQGEDLLTWARLAATGTIAYCTVPQSIFHIGESHLNGQPKRIPDPADPVGKGLEELHIQHPEIKGLVAYIALWHKMRASIYLRLPDSSKMCRKEIRKAQRWHFKWLRLLPYSILSYTPYALRMKMLKMLNTR